MPFDHASIHPLLLRAGGGTTLLLEVPGRRQCAARSTQVRPAGKKKKPALHASPRVWSDASQPQTALRAIRAHGCPRSDPFDVGAVPKLLLLRPAHSMDAGAVSNLDDQGPSNDEDQDEEIDLASRSCRIPRRERGAGDRSRTGRAAAARLRAGSAGAHRSVPAASRRLRAHRRRGRASCSATDRSSTSGPSAGRTRRAARRMTPDAIFRIASQIEGAHEHRDHDARRGRKDRPRRSGEPLHPGVRAYHRGVARRQRAHGRAGEAADHDQGSAHPHRRHLVRHRRLRRHAVRGEGTRPGRGLGLVHRRQERADLHDDGAARDRCPFVVAAGRGVGVRLQHRRPRLRRRARVRHPARRVHSHAHHRAARHERHVFLPAAEQARRGSPRVRERQHQPRRPRAGSGPRAGRLRRRPAPQLLRRRRPALDGARLRALPADDARARRVGRRANALAEDGGRHDHQPERHALCRRAGSASGWASRPSTASGPTASRRSAPSAGAARTAARTRSIPPNVSSSCS